MSQNFSCLLALRGLGVREMTQGCVRVAFRSSNADFCRLFALTNGSKSSSSSPGTPAALAHRDRPLDLRLLGLVGDEPAVVADAIAERLVPAEVAVAPFLVGLYLCDALAPNVPLGALWGAPGRRSEGRVLSFAGR